jgi:hypothetical protein
MALFVENQEGLKSLFFTVLLHQPTGDNLVKFDLKFRELLFNYQNLSRLALGEFSDYQK